MSRMGFGLVAAVVLIAGGGAVAIAHGQSAHPGEHYVSGHADPRDVTVHLMKLRNAGTSEGMVWSHSCGFEENTVYVPVHLSVASRGGVTLHVTATVSNRAAGHDNVASATQDFAMDGTTMGNWVHVPLSVAQWRHGTDDCAITHWTVTSGAWFSNDD